MNKFPTMNDLKEEFRSNVLSSFLILSGAIISIIFGNLTKNLSKIYGILCVKKDDFHDTQLYK
ncbi:hypothetical protein CUC43_31865 (plasmid) [Bacillus thuringiensis LM1212]|nr:hypothetical protein CUC43_31865 [Bacillus thuringiensis LM1212]QDF27152.1 hypothetical protein FJR70_30480 [Bacillus tropicus]